LTAQATEYFVAPDGDDAKPGSVISSFRTIQRGAELAQPGDVISVRSGVYHEHINPLLVDGPKGRMVFISNAIEGIQ
jgi:hypothetical protein